MKTKCPDINTHVSTAENSSPATIICVLSAVKLTQLEILDAPIVAAQSKKAKCVAATADLHFRLSALSAVNQHSSETTAKTVDKD